jgi:hypothetical protein
MKDPEGRFEATHSKYLRGTEFAVLTYLTKKNRSNEKKTRRQKTKRDWNEN